MRPLENSILKSTSNQAAGLGAGNRPARRRGLIVLALAVGVWLSAATGQAAAIIWGTPATISGYADVTNAGTALYAYAGTAVTVNGVTFTATSNGTTWGNVSFTSFGGYNAVFGANAAPFNTLTNGYTNLLATAAWGSGTSGTVTLNGLISGHTYSVQIWVNDSRGGYQYRYENVTSTGGNTVTLYFAPNSNSAGAVGQYAVGTFTASGTSQSFSVNGNAVVQINAISVRDIGSYVFTPPPFYATRVNLAKYQPVTTDSTNGSQGAQFITDGLTVNDSYWQSGAVAPHWAQVTFPFPVPVGSVQLAMGLDSVPPPTIFKLQYLTNGTWMNVPGTSVGSNTNKEVNLVFTTPITASSFRFYDSLDGNVYIREMALYPPNGTNGYPFGTDFNIDLARKQPTYATANTYGNWPLLASDGRVNAASAWETTLVGSNALQINLQFTNKIGSAHLYSGATGVPPLTNFVLQYWTAGAWANIPGGSVTGNTNGALVIPFTTPVTTTKVQLVFTNADVSAVQELCIFSANSNGGYPLGTGVTTNTPVTAQYDTYSDSYYYLSNAVAGQVVVESNGVPVLGSVSAYTWATQATNWPAQYQVLLNYDNGSYRLINRNSGLCLAGAQLTTNAGAALVEEDYSALPDQEWNLQPIDGVNVYLVNQFSGLVLDKQGGALVQNIQTNSPSQYWQISLAQIFPKKGLAHTGNNIDYIYHPFWCHDYGPGTSAQAPPGVVYYPADEQPWYDRGNTLAKNYWSLQPIYRTTAASTVMLGYCEPDNTSAYFDPTNSAIAWMNDQNLDMPVTAPAAANVLGTWIPTFLGYVTNWGCRLDAMPSHEYSGNNSSGSSAIWMNTAQTAYNDYGLPIWMTEWNIVDWGGTGYWSEEDNYNAMAEFLWRVESVPWFQKYSLFVWGASASSPMAPNPWTRTTPAPTGYAYDTNNVLTPFAELYAGWDDDANVETNKAYFIYNCGTRKQLANMSDPQYPDAKSILVRDSVSKWTLMPTPTAGQYYLVSSVDGRRLSYNGTSLTLVAAGTTGTAVQWSLASYQYGWYYLQHPATGKELSLAYDNSTFTATYSMVANTTTGTAVQWRFIVPYTPVPSVWKGGGNASWANTNNWVNTQITPPFSQKANNLVVFNNLSTNNLNTVLNLASNPTVLNNFTVYGITVSNPPGPVTIGATNLLVIGNFIDLSGASQDLTINSPVYFGENQGYGRQLWTVTNNRTLSLNGAVAGANDLIISGGGTVALGGTNTFTGDTIVSGGTLNMTGAYLPSVFGITNIFTVNGGALNFNMGAGTANFYGDGYKYSPQIGNGSYTGTVTLQSGTLNVNTMPNADAGNYAGLLLGCNSSTANGTLMVNGGNLNVPGRILIAANGVGSQGKLTINGGNVTLGTPGSSGSYAVNGQGLIWFGGSTSTVNLYGGTLALWSLYDPTAGSSVTVNLSGGTLQAIYNNPTFTYQTAGSLTLKVSTNGAVIDPASYAITIANALTHDSGLSSADCGLTVSDSVGGGTLTLSAANTYTGPTTISAGTLALSGIGSLASQKIIVAGGATFDVSGKTTTFALGTGSTLTNSSVGAVISGTNNCSVGTLALVTDGTNACFIQTNGIMTLSASTVIKVNNTGYTLSPGTYSLIAAATTGNHGKVIGPLPAVVVAGNGAAGAVSLQIDGAGSLILVVTNTITSTPANISFAFGGGTLTLTWPGDHLGWIAQSNALSLGNSNYWFDILGSQSATNLSIPINPATPQVFYRLRYPF